MARQVEVAMVAETMAAEDTDHQAADIHIDQDRVAMADTDQDMVVTVDQDHMAVAMDTTVDLEDEDGMVIDGCIGTTTVGFRIGHTHGQTRM